MANVLIAGATGAMGQKAVDLVNSMPDMEITAVLAPHLDAADREQYHLGEGVKVFNLLTDVDPTVADIWLGLLPVVGTTGLTDEQEQELIELSESKHLGGLIAPNFGMSAVLLMKFAQEAAKYFPDVEVIEMHHADKKDAPSGTALSTAKLIDQVREPHESNPDETESLAGVRGGDYHGIKIHSVRLPGYIAHEQVLFGGAGESLTIRQDSFDRQSFMSGVKVALEKVGDLDHLVVGLEKIL